MLVSLKLIKVVFEDFRISKKLFYFDYKKIQTNIIGLCRQRNSFHRFDLKLNGGIFTHFACAIPTKTISWTSGTSAALIRADMFSNSPQERPGEAVPKKNRPQIVPCNISSPRPQMCPAGRKSVGLLDPQKIVPGFSFNVLWTEQINVILSILLDRPIRLLEFGFFSPLRRILC